MSPTVWADIPGARLCYTSRGEGLPVVLVHGTALDRRMWEPQDPLSSRWQLLSLDLRGFGRSSQPGDAPYTHADDVAAFLDALGIARAAVIGFSLGGRVAAQFAVAQPDRLAALVLIDAALDGVEFGPELSALFASLGSMALERGMSVAIEHWLACGLFERARRNPALEVTLQRIVGEFDGAPWLRPNPVVKPLPPTLSRLGEIRAPTLVLVGEHDHADFRRIARVYADGIAGAEFAVVPGAGHVSNMEAPAWVNARIEEFLARHYA
jgi:pimeloyl-ACP methyl ester carboxylesterase